MHVLAVFCVQLFGAVEVLESVLANIYCFFAYMFTMLYVRLCPSAFLPLPLLQTVYILPISVCGTIMLCLSIFVGSSDWLWWYGMCPHAFFSISHLDYPLGEPRMFCL